MVPIRALVASCFKLNRIATSCLTTRIQCVAPVPGILYFQEDADFIDQTPLQAAQEGSALIVVPTFPGYYDDLEPEIVKIEIVPWPEGRLQGLQDCTRVLKVSFRGTITSVSTEAWRQAFDHHGGTRMAGSTKQIINKMRTMTSANRLQLKGLGDRFVRVIPSSSSVVHVVLPRSTNKTSYAGIGYHKGGYSAKFCRDGVRIETGGFKAERDVETDRQCAIMLQDFIMLHDLAQNTIEPEASIPKFSYVTPVGLSLQPNGSVGC